MSGESIKTSGDGRLDSERLAHVKSTGGISFSPEQFEQLYLAPKTPVKGGLRQTFGNPTAIGIIGFIMPLGPLACDMMGWRGAGGNGASNIPAYLFFGGILMIVGAILEFFLGNTFPSVVFFTYGAFWLTFAGTLLPQFNAYAAYAPPGGSPAEGLETTGFNAGFGFFALSMTLVSFCFLICSIRTNMAFVFIFICLVLTLGFNCGGFFTLALGYKEHAVMAGKLIVASGACAFAATAAGWYIFFSIMLASVDFPFALPLGDLSTVVPSGSSKV